MKRLIASVTALTAFLCAGCGADSSKNSNAENSTTATTAVSTTVVTTTTTTTKPEIRQYDKNVYNIYRYFKEKCSKVDKYIEYDKDTDPNKSYGSDTSYAQKLNFSFTDIKEEQLVHPDLGGTIEIFKSEFGASSKEKEYSANKDDIDYHVFRYKNVILRITKEEDTGTLNTLKTALQEFFKDPQDYMKDKDSAQKKETHPLGDKEYYKEQCEEISYDDIARDRNGLKGKFVYPDYRAVYRKNSIFCFKNRAY